MTIIIAALNRINNNLNEIMRIIIKLTINNNNGKHKISNYQLLSQKNFHT